jgi:hypothetical protein
MNSAEIRAHSLAMQRGAELMLATNERAIAQASAEHDEAMVRNLTGLSGGLQDLLHDWVSGGMDYVAECREEIG